MELSAAAQWIAFGVFSFLAIAGALGMTTTMSMFRSGIFLMASFFGVAGLFILLSADLLGLLQVMMYTGGMLVMILFMVLFSHDPGGDMMTSQMKLPLVEKLFSLGLDRGEHGGHGQHGGHGDMPDMSDMSMFTSIKKPAAVLALITGSSIITLLLAVPAWPTVREIPDPDSARRIGDLLMNKYMIAFEGAGLLILLGIFGAVFVQRPGAHPDARERELLQAAVAEHPASIAPETESESNSVSEHKSESGSSTP